MDLVFIAAAAALWGLMVLLVSLDVGMRKTLNGI